MDTALRCASVQIRADPMLAKLRDTALPHVPEGSSQLGEAGGGATLGGLLIHDVNITNAERGGLTARPLRAFIVGTESNL